MAAHAINRYKADLRDFQFLLFEQFNLQDVLGKGPFADWDADQCKMVLSEVYRFACEVTGPLNQIGDQSFVNGIAAWDGTRWSKLGTGLNEAFSNPSGCHRTSAGD